MVVARLTDIVVGIKPTRSERDAPPLLPKPTRIVEQRAIDSDEYAAQRSDAAPVERHFLFDEPYIPPPPRPERAPGEFTPDPRGCPPGRFMQGNRNERKRREVFVDLWQELRHEQPPPDKAELAKLLRSAARAPVLIMKRDAWIRLAAWAIAHAVETSEALPDEPPPLRVDPSIFDTEAA